nr:hypothetical protein [uncultured Ligilactobacillus sp.]
MYIIVNRNNNKICSEWNHLNYDDIHICWKTLEEIQNANSYRNDTTRVKKFVTKYKAQKYIENNFNGMPYLAIISTNRLQRSWDNLMVKIKNKFHNHQDHTHYMCFMILYSILN